MRDRNKPFRLKQQAPQGYFTLQDTAKYLRVSEQTIRRYIKKYNLPGVRIGGNGRYLINKAELEKWINENGQ